MAVKGIGAVRLETQTNIQTNTNNDISGNEVQEAVVDTLDSLAQSVWQSSLPYEAGELKIFDNSGTKGVYECLAGTAPGESPSTTPAKWELIGGSSSSLTFENGLTEASEIVKLGGVLTGATLITTDNNTFSILNTSSLGLILSSIKSELGGTSGSYITIDHASGEIIISSTNYVNMISQNSEFVIGNDGTNVNKFTDGDNGEGIIYAADYSGSFVDRSLVDKGYVDGLVSRTGLIQVARGEVLFSNTTQTAIVTLPAGSVVWDIGISVITSFNGSGTDQLDVGSDLNPDQFVNNNNLSNQDFGLALSPNGLDGYVNMSLPINISGSTQITFRYTDQNSDATQGQAFVYIHYSLH